MPRDHLPTLRALWRGNGHTEPLSAGELDDVARALLRLQRGLTGERSLAGTDYMESAPLLGAYLLYYWPVSYRQVWQSAADCHLLCTHLKEAGRGQVRVLDVGSGPAPASCALCDLLQERGVDVRQVTLVDSSRKALSLAAGIFARDFPGVQVRVQVQDILSPSALAAPEPHDVIVMSHVLNELWEGEPDAVQKRAAFLARACTHLADGGFIHICEPALRTTCRALLSLRDSLLGGNLAVRAPCPSFSAACPALKAGQTCHAEAAWAPPEQVSRLAQRARLDRVSVKMSYLILQKHGHPEPAAPGTHRVVSEALRNKAGRVRFLLCDGERRLPLSARQDDAHARAEGFFALSRYDRVRLSSPERRPGAAPDAPAYGMAEGTCLHVEKFAERGEIVYTGTVWKTRE